MDSLATSFLRVTSSTMIHNAGSGHTGVCLGASEIVYSLYKNAFVCNFNPNFFNRDRIVFSAGHASALIYSCLHLFGFDVTIDDLKSFRQLGSRATGHPEVNVLPGIDASTGPLGQGIGMSVGLAVAEKYLANKYNKKALDIVNHYTYCFCGDGCLMEGVGCEAIAIAGNLQLNKLILIYDKNDITIEGGTDLSSKTDIAKFFKANNWNVIQVKNGNDASSIDKAIMLAKQSKNKPSIIICKTEIGHKCDLAGSNTIHGKPLTSEQINTLRKTLNYYVKDYEIPSELKKHIDNLLSEKQEIYNNQLQKLEEYKKKYSKEYDELFSNKPNIDLTKIKDIKLGDLVDMRELLHKVLNCVDFNFVGGCADVAPSTKAYFDNCGYFSGCNLSGKNIAFGVREHAMGAITNGICLHGGLRSFCSTFFSFSNYMTPAIRLSALMKNPVLYIFTHDSLATGEDGPTHQPIEQLATLRAMPGVIVFRPSGLQELCFAFDYYFKNNLPVVIILPRQEIDFVQDDFMKSKFGAYKIYSSNSHVAQILSTGSDVGLAISVAKRLKNIDVVSIPSIEIFEEQDNNYKDSILKGNFNIALECSGDNIWYKFTPNVLKLNSFGCSGKGEDVLSHYGFNIDKLAKNILSTLKQNNIISN